jgi:hypothetical protein
MFRRLSDVNYMRIVVRDVAFRALLLLNPPHLMLPGTGASRFGFGIEGLYMMKL